MGKPAWVQVSQLSIFFIMKIFLFLNFLILNKKIFDDLKEYTFKKMYLSNSGSWLSTLIRYFILDIGKIFYIYKNILYYYNLLIN